MCSVKIILESVMTTRLNFYQKVATLYLYCPYHKYLGTCRYYYSFSNLKQRTTQNLCSCELGTNKYFLMRKTENIE